VFVITKYSVIPAPIFDICIAYTNSINPRHNVLQSNSNIVKKKSKNRVHYFAHCTVVSARQISTFFEFECFLKLNTQLFVLQFSKSQLNTKIQCTLVKANNTATEKFKKNYTFFEHITLHTFASARQNLDFLRYFKIFLI
jgi:hypothetical protein